MTKPKFIRKKKKKQYLKIDGGLAFRKKGWSKKDMDKFLDKIIEVAESFGKDVQMTISVTRKKEKAVLKDFIDEIIP